MMSNETFALLTPLAILAAVLGTGGLMYWDIVRRHPVKVKKERRADGAMRASAATHAETSEDNEVNQRIALRLQENAVSTARIVREANQLASSVEQFTKAVTGVK